MRLFRNKKIVLGVLAVAIVFTGGLTPFHNAAAALFDIGSIAAKSVGFVASVAGYIFGWIASVVFWLGGLLVELALNINSQLLSETNAVLHTGWGIVLSFANLGFVLAIIVIAFATIFRLQSYAMKQILWKLIVAALLVNFSLVIAGAFINVSDNLSEVFLAKATLKGEGNFTTAIANALGVQSFLKTKDMLSGKEEDTKQKIIEATNVFGGAMLTLIVSVFFIAGFTLLGALTLLAIAVMLIIRYVVLSILLIISPLAWLLWIFPGTSNLWQKWWNNFLRWTFFAPIVLFFLYLPIATMTEMKKYANAVISKNQAADINSVISSNPLTFGIDNILNLVVVLGLMIGGLIVANSLSITGAKTFYGAAQGAGKWAQGAVGRKGLQWGTGFLRRKGAEPGAKSIADKVSEWSAKSKLAKYTILPGLMARGIAKFSAAGGENLVSQTKAAASKRSLNENIAMLGYADAPTRHGILQHIQEKDLLDKVPDGIKYIDKKYKIEAARFGQGVGYSNIEKSLGMNVGMKEAFDKKDTKAFFAEGKKFFSKFSEKDWSKPQYNEMYGSKPGHGTSQELHNARQQVFAYAIGEVNPGQLAKTMSKIKGENFDNYEKAVNEAVSKMYETNPEKAKNVAESFKKALGRRTLGIEWESTEFAESAKPTESKEGKKS